MTPRTLLHRARQRLLDVHAGLGEETLDIERLRRWCMSCVEDVDFWLDLERRALKALRPVRRATVSGKLRAYIYLRDGRLCAICLGVVAPDQLHLDHEIPVCLGGLTETDNLRVTHAACNLAKGASVQ